MESIKTKIEGRKEGRRIKGGELIYTGGGWFSRFFRGMVRQREAKREFGINPNSKQREKEQEISIYVHGKRRGGSGWMVGENSNI